MLTYTAIAIVLHLFCFFWVLSVSFPHSPKLWQTCEYKGHTSNLLSVSMKNQVFCSIARVLLPLQFLSLVLSPKHLQGLSAWCTSDVFSCNCCDFAFSQNSKGLDDWPFFPKCSQSEYAGKKRDSYPSCRYQSYGFCQYFRSLWLCSSDNFLHTQMVILISILKRKGLT